MSHIPDVVVGCERWAWDGHQTTTPRGLSRRGPAAAPARRSRASISLEAAECPPASGTCRDQHGCGPSDRVGSRVGPLRLVTASIGVAMAALATGAAVAQHAARPLGVQQVASLPVALAIAALPIASVLTVSPNGLAFTAVAEDAGRAWAGRALGIQNTGQNAVAALTPPLIATLVGAHGYPLAFALAGAPALLACTLVPRDPR
jgi:hypothetical protein